MNTKEQERIRVGVQGRITIPKRIRDKYNISHLDAYRVYVVSDVDHPGKDSKRNGDEKTRSLEEYMGRR